ncbi:hypothetical protein H8B09_19805 [Paenibacillus sp. PR3]|uniref:Uncharacterized protein n=1 Tax=Paenibacillus terricola TaxID=2763503 RepID=A0ABR8N184_9BACL|nr:hypothetical protein [Paenibacillus terricola]MBD3921021.1 hypothetical protein [Paenibacillus terricola]
MANNIEKQYKLRLTHLPKNNKQSVIIDVRGQKYTDDMLDVLVRKYDSKTGGNVDITFMTY